MAAVTTSSTSPDASQSPDASTKTLVVNPAFLQEMKDSNQEVWQTQHAVRQICHSDLQPNDLLKQLVELLDDFRGQIALQFALEEAYGYQSVRTDSLPHSSRCIRLAQTAHNQHCGLYLQLSGLSEQAEELQYRGIEREPLIELIGRVMEFDQALRDHELLEGDLIDQSFDVTTKHEV